MVRIDRKHRSSHPGFSGDQSESVAFREFSKYFPAEHAASNDGEMQGCQAR